MGSKLVEEKGVSKGTIARAGAFWSLIALPIVLLLRRRKRRQERRSLWLRKK